MPAISELNELLTHLSPSCDYQDYVFCTLESARYGSNTVLEPIASFQEDEGLSLIVLKDHADLQGIDYEAVYNKISFGVHSSLQAVGLTAAVASSLSERGICANVVSAFYHDHVFVGKDQVETALGILNKLKVD